MPTDATFPLDCLFERQGVGWFDSRPAASARLYETDTALMMTLSGSHQDPGDGDGPDLGERVYELWATPVDDYDLIAWFFYDEETIGVLSTDHTGTFRISVHVQGANGAYAEHFEGYCEATS